MNREDKEQFAGMISGYLKVMGRKVDQDVLEIWWRTLERWGIDDVSKALQMAIEEGGNPIPATTIKYLPDPYGHPNPEEAWNAAQKDEYTDGAYMTQEMLGAICAASDSIERGDLIAARRCFIDVYTQKVQESKRERRPASFSYFAPLGQAGMARAEKQQIEEAATRDAEVKGWITHEQAQGVLAMLDRPISDEMKRITDKSADRTKLLQ